MKLNNIGNVLLKIFACIFTLMSSYLLFINVTSNYGRLFPMNKFIVIIGAIIILAILLMLKFMFNKLSDKTLVKINLITGRSHQIRVQFSSRDYPLYGDMKYNKRAKLK